MFRSRLRISSATSLRGNSASEAEAVFAVTMNGGRNYCQLSLLDATLDGIYTFRCWTPFQAVLVIDVGSSKEHLVPIAW
jgi:hypothetical protein